MVPNHALPLRHLDRMHLVVPRNLSNRLDAHQGFQSHLGLEGACIPFPFSIAHSSAVLSCPAEPEKSNLATGPNYGVHFFLPYYELILDILAQLLRELPRAIDRRGMSHQVANEVFRVPVLLVCVRPLQSAGVLVRIGP